jgi:hypothetical protein
MTEQAGSVLMCWLVLGGTQIKTCLRYKQSSQRFLVRFLSCSRWLHKLKYSHKNPSATLLTKNAIWQKETSFVVILMLMGHTIKSAERNIFLGFCHILGQIQNNHYLHFIHKTIKDTSERPPGLIKIWPITAPKFKILLSVTN